MDDNIIKKFPESGQKDVYLINNPLYGLCIKKIPKNISFISRMKKEINIQEDINSVYFPKIYYSKITENECIIYEEYIIGKDLTNYIGRNSKYYDNEFECLNLLKELVIGLSDVWNKNIVHRDIKPSNIIIREDTNKPVILDLGIAKNLDSTTQTQGGMWGTPGYSSPEQFFNRRDLFDIRSDMFSLGIVTYELFYGEKPFIDANELASANCDFTKNNLNPSKEFKKIISKLLEKLPYKRYKNANAILVDIDNLNGVEINE